MTLDQVFDDVWCALAAGAGPARSPFTFMSLATTGCDGAPEARTIVLREADRATASLRLHTDARSPKLDEIRAEPRVALVGVDLDAGVQVRLNGIASIDDDAARKRLWHAARPHSLVQYRAPVAPATPVLSPEAAWAPGVGEGEGGDDSEDGFANFCVLSVALTRIEYLVLDPAGHRRARFDARRAWRGEWVAP